MAYLVNTQLQEKVVMVLDCPLQNLWVNVHAQDLAVLTSRGDVDELLEGDDCLACPPALVAFPLDKHLRPLAVAANFAAHHPSQPFSLEASAFAVGTHVGLIAHLAFVTFALWTDHADVEPNRNATSKGSLRKNNALFTYGGHRRAGIVIQEFGAFCFAKNGLGASCYPTVRYSTVEP